MTTMPPVTEERQSEKTHDRIAQFARMHETVSELELITSDMDDAIDDARLIALNAALEARRSEHGGDGFVAIAEQLNLAIDRLNASRTAMSAKIGELKTELENAPTVESY